MGHSRSMDERALEMLLRRAQEHRDAAEWDSAIRLFSQAEAIAPGVGSIRHNLAVAYFAKGESRAAAVKAKEAVQLQPSLWQSHALLAKIHRSSGNIKAAHSAWQRVLEGSPGNPVALLGLADLSLNEFGDPHTALSLAQSLRDQPTFRGDAELTTLMAQLYIGDESAGQLTKRLIAFSHEHLRLPAAPRRRARDGRRRIGVMSPLFSASPVYYLTHSTFRVVAREHDLIMFNRGYRSDHGTAAFKDIASEWFDVASFEPAALARRLADADLDILIDLGGWSDVAGLAALSSKPAARMYKWVGGQSATTGLDMFDGWIGDEWQSPQSHAALYAEPIINMEGGYVDYTPPPGLLKHASRGKVGIGLLGNPAKIGARTIASWPRGVEKVILIDRRYVHDQTRSRVTDLLGRAGIGIEGVVVPEGHGDYLRALAGCEAIVNTQPYSAGLTAVEAHWLGVRLLTGGEAGALFCSRHHLSHAQSGGRNPQLATQFLKLVSQ